MFCTLGWSNRPTKLTTQFRYEDLHVLQQRYYSRIKVKQAFQIKSPFGLWSQNSEKISQLDKKRIKKCF